MSDELNCWICKRTFKEALKAFNEAIQSDAEISKEIKSRYIEGQKEFFPDDYDRFVSFRQATVTSKKYSVTGETVGRVQIWLCPVCSGLIESILEGVDEMIENRVTKEELENVTIRINEGE